MIIKSKIKYVVSSPDGKVNILTVGKTVIKIGSKITDSTNKSINAFDVTRIKNDGSVMVNIIFENHVVRDTMSRGTIIYLLENFSVI